MTSIIRDFLSYLIFKSKNLVTSKPSRKSFVEISLVLDLPLGLKALNKVGYMATPVACGWAGAVLEKVTTASGQEPYAQEAQKRRKSKKGTDQPTDRPMALPMDRPTN